MQKFFSELIGAPIIADNEQIAIGFISELIIDPLNGAIAGISLNRNFKKVIPAVDIRSLGNPTIISTIEAVSEPEEILKIKQILCSGAKVINNNVYTKSGIHLGKVYDIALNLNMLSMTKIAVAKTFLGLIKINEILISCSDIVEITPEKIIVLNHLEKKKAKALTREKAKACAACE